MTTSARFESRCVGETGFGHMTFFGQESMEIELSHCL